jgi:hypothetical protein
MNKRMLYVLALIGIVVVVLLFNRQGASIQLPFVTVKMTAAFAYLIFTAFGVAIGGLMK